MRNVNLILVVSQQMQILFIQRDGYTIAEVRVRKDDYKNHK